jgi:hypothetical protein
MCGMYTLSLLSLVITHAMPLPSRIQQCLPNTTLALNCVLASHLQEIERRKREQAEAAAFIAAASKPPPGAEPPTVSSYAEDDDEFVFKGGLGSAQQQQQQHGDAAAAAAGPGPSTTAAAGADDADEYERERQRRLKMSGDEAFAARARLRGWVCLGVAVQTNGGKGLRGPEIATPRRSRGVAICLACRRHANAVVHKYGGCLVGVA